MTYVADEIASQPDCWRRAAELAAASTGPARGPASGSRSSAAAPRGSWRWRTRRCAKRAGHGETDAFQASEFPAGRRVRPGRRDHPLRHHHRGRSTCSPRCAATADHRARRRRRSPPAARAGRRRRGAALRRRASVVQTRFATSALALLRARLGEDLGRARRRRRGRRRARRCRSTRPTIEQVTFLGRGWTVGLAAGGGAEVPRGGRRSGPRPTRRWTTGTARSRSPRPAGRSGRSARCRPGWPSDGRRDRRAPSSARQPAHAARPDGRPDPGAAVRRRAGRGTRSGPGRARAT